MDEWMLLKASNIDEAFEQLYGVLSEQGYNVETDQPAHQIKAVKGDEYVQIALYLDGEKVYAEVTGEPEEAAAACRGVLDALAQPIDDKEESQSTEKSEATEETKVPDTTEAAKPQEEGEKAPAVNLNQSKPKQKFDFKAHKKELAIGIIICAVLAVFGIGYAAYQSKITEEHAQQLYQESLGKIEQNQLDEVVNQIDEFLSEHPDVENAGKLSDLREQASALKTLTDDTDAAVKKSQEGKDAQGKSLIENLCKLSEKYSSLNEEAVNNKLIEQRDKLILAAASIPSQEKGSSQFDSLQAFYDEAKKTSDDINFKKDHTTNSFHLERFLNKQPFDEAKWNEPNAKAKEEGKRLKEEADKKAAEEAAAKKAAAEKKAQEEAAKKASAPALSYDEMMRNPTAYKNQYVKVEGKVLQVIDDLFGKSYRIAMNGDYDTVALVTYTGNYPNGNILEDDYIRFYGTFNGTTSYTSVLGASITVPKITSSEYE